MIGRMHHVVLDCPDPPALATFYSSLLGPPVTYQDDDWVVVAVNETTSGLAFQRAPGDPAGHPFCLIRRPRWAPPVSAIRNPGRDSASN